MCIKDNEREREIVKIIYYEALEMTRQYSRQKYTPDILQGNYQMTNNCFISRLRDDNTE